MTFYAILYEKLTNAETVQNESLRLSLARGIMEKIREGNTMTRVYEFLKASETYYLATVEENQPRVRSFDTVHIFEDKLYIKTGKGKSVANQIVANPKVELCAMKSDEWIRVVGTLVLDECTEAQESMLNDYPSLRAMYTTGPNGNTAVYYFKDATATISSFSHEPVVIKL